MENKQQELREERYAAARRVTILSVIINVFLSIGKVIAGILGNSAAMLADGIHSASDLVTDGVVLLAMRIAKRGADEDHPFGHGKFETLATQFVSVALLVVAVGIGIDAWERLLNPNLTPPTYLALGAAFISIVAKEAIFQYTYRLGKRYNAKAMIANAWHHRSDAVSSIAALVGIAGAMAGLPIFDPLAAIVVAGILGKVGLDLFLEALQDLTDSKSAIDSEVQNQITKLVNSVPGVMSAHLLNPRGLGPDIRVDVHVVVNRYLSVSEGHQIAEIVRKHLLDEVAAVTDVLVHIDPEEDLENPVPMFSARDKIRKQILELIADIPIFKNINRLMLHYRRSGVLLELDLVVDWDYPLPLIKAEIALLSERIMAVQAEIDEVTIGYISLNRKRENIKQQAN